MCKINEIGFGGKKIDEQEVFGKIKLLILNSNPALAANELAESLPLFNEKENHYLFSFLCAADLDILFFTVLYERIF